MPLHQAQGIDDLSDISVFTGSHLVEMLSQLQTLAHPWREREWTHEVELELGRNFIEEIRTLYAGFHMGCDFMEVAVTYENSGNIPEFLEYFRELDERSIAFYFLGRVYAMESIPEKVSKEAITTLLAETGTEEIHQHLGASFDWTDDVSGLQEQLYRIWSLYWEKYYSKDMERQENLWKNSIEEKEEYLFRHGGKALLHNLVGFKEMPEQIPAHMPYTKLEFIPVTKVYRPYCMFYGYGVINVIYDCNRSQKDDEQVEAELNTSLLVLRALGDKNRLRILKIIAAEDHRFNGRYIAEKLNLSTSVISRHLGQLKEASLVTESSPDNRNIYYSLNWEKIESLSPSILKYLA